MTNPHNKGKGEAVKFLRDRVEYRGSMCLIWPFFCNPISGYGSFGYNGEHYYAHQFMCALVHGPRPSRRYSDPLTVAGTGKTLGMGSVQTADAAWKSSNRCPVMTDDC
jgi:hypothetical protein